MTVSVDLARALLDMGARLRGPGDGHDGFVAQAEQQLRGVVAIHNLLEREGVAYLADEVGMGKTYVALGAAALFRHYQPSFRIAVIAPRENIQAKWMKEWANFVTYITRVPDLRVKGLHGGPARPLVKCDNLRQFIRETTVDPDRDFFLRLSSFSLGTGDQEDDVKALHARFRRELPWLDKAVTTFRKREYKDSLAKALCCALPVFDLLIVDEAHNLKHGFADKIAARNRNLAFMFGRPSEQVDRHLFRDYGVRAKRVLLLSATPLEDDYRQLWNQLDIFGKGSAFAELRDPLESEERKRTVAKRFLIRRVTTLSVGGADVTKNLYRREWRRGGFANWDQPIKVEDVQQQLVVALVQKKVSELLNSQTFGASFQMGMLASFESFLETIKRRRVDDDTGNFDDAEQTEVAVEREGIDVQTINDLAADYRRRFNGRELPHPKVDALVSHLSQAWRDGRKALVFLRRVASVWEVKERLDREYNDWLLGSLREAFADHRQVLKELDQLYCRYCEERSQNRAARLAVRMGQDGERDGEQDRGGDDTFFAWFFRGKGPKGGWLSGAKFAQRFGEAQYEVSTFFEDNYTAGLLGVEPSAVLPALATAVGLSIDRAEAHLLERAGWYLTPAKKAKRREQFEAVQAGAVELLRDGALDDALRQAAAEVWQLRFALRRQPRPGPVKPNVSALSFETLFSDLRRAEWRDLQKAIWPCGNAAASSHKVRDRELRRELLATVSRLGHPLIDLYITAMRQRGSLKTGADGDESVSSSGEALLRTAFLHELDSQRLARSGRWRAFDELKAVSDHFDLILDVNEPAVRTRPLADAGRLFGDMLRRQQPIGGMTGEVSKTLVRQFRMPGYPFVLLSTDLLQEGEDLHTFCSDVHHYGLAWTPSAIEQRIGRIDRVRSKTERAARGLESVPEERLLQVFYPHLEDTVERLQVRRVLRRMHEFVRLMHEGLGGAPTESSKLNVREEMVGPSDLPRPIETPLKTGFPVQDQHLAGRRRGLAVTAAMSARTAARLRDIPRRALSDVRITWDETRLELDAPSGTVILPSGRRQHFTLRLDSFGEHVVVRCVSPVGSLDDDLMLQNVKRLSRRVPEQLGIIEEADDKGIDLTVEEEVLLGDPRRDTARIGWLVRRVTSSADRLENELWGRDIAGPTG